MRICNLGNAVRLISVLGFLACISGCTLWYTHSNFIQPPLPQYAMIMEDVPDEGKAKVAVFFIQDADICDCTGFQGWNAQLRAYGFRKVYFGYMHHKDYFAREIECILENAPDTRIVIVGYEWGSCAAYSLAQKIAPAEVALLATIHRDRHGFTRAKGTPENVLEEFHLPEKKACDKNQPAESQPDYPMDSIGQMLLGKIGKVARDAFLESADGKKADSPKESGKGWNFLAPRESEEKKKGQVVPPRVTLLK